ncbi:hypothetical protein V5799_019562 [Amblyomma americanum]|uniref:Nicotinamide n-methyltransferase n=1 Tax=Amblyomma americanum TaxID=6943 RepID=A0AAQ4EWK0_AMBAM
MDQQSLVNQIRSEFSPDNYPAHSIKMLPVLDFIRKELHTIFKSALSGGGDLLEVGCGPTVYTAMAASVAFERIVMADLVPANVREVRKWLDAAPDAKDWTLFAERQAAQEGARNLKEGADAVIARTRRAVRDVTLCNIAEPGVFLDGRQGAQFDAVVACLCLDSGSVDQAAHRCATRNLAALLKPGGMLVACGVTGNPYYTLCTKRFPSLVSCEDSIRDSLLRAGLTVHHWAAEKSPAFMRPYLDYGSAYVTVASKAAVDGMAVESSVIASGAN